MWENQTLYTKLQNLEHVFIGAPLTKPGDPSDTQSQLAKEYIKTSLMNESGEFGRR